MFAGVVDTKSRCLATLVPPARASGETVRSHETGEEAKASPQASSPASPS
jgi:hypothetical protein